MFRFSNVRNFQMQLKKTIYTTRLPFGSTKKRKVVTKTILYKNIRENPLPESCVGLFITLCTGWILKKRAIKLVFVSKNVKNQKLGEKRIYPPLTPDQPPFKGGRYV